MDSPGTLICAPNSNGIKETKLNCCDIRAELLKHVNRYFSDNQCVKELLKKTGFI